ncbi:hypothetical protein, partial [Bradyrhizobium sp.]|uniref:hypothetical protein n=1 Tax=Bradyrhizobium sp. TaxID=376 RepID=UPI003C6F20AC
MGISHDLIVGPPPKQHRIAQTLKVLRQAARVHERSSSPATRAEVNPLNDFHAAMNGNQATLIAMAAVDVHISLFEPRAGQSFSTSGKDRSNGACAGHDDGGRHGHSRRIADSFFRSAAFIDTRSKTRLRALAARCARSDAEISCPRKPEGVGDAGRPMHPQPRVRIVGSKSAHEYSQRSHRNHPASPHAMVYGLYALSSVTMLFCHRRLTELL